MKNYKMPELEEAKTLADDFFTKCNEFVKKLKSNQQENE